MPLKIEKEEIVFDAPVTLNKLVKRLIASFVGSTINALNVELFDLNNTSPTNIATISNGQNGQTIHLLGDGQTTLTNAGNIRTRTGASVLLATGLIYQLTYMKTSTVGYWYCHQ